MGSGLASADLASVKALRDCHLFMGGRNSLFPLEKTQLHREIDLVFRVSWDGCEGLPARRGFNLCVVREASNVKCHFG